IFPISNCETIFVQGNVVTSKGIL
ncbi:peptidase, partial [Listeria monocytogenes]|nr:peptidase [Listeria monocytogenes]